MKTCFKCNKHKPLADFYKHPMTADGRLGKCKECTKLDVRTSRRKRVDYYREYDRTRYQENEDRRRASDRRAARCRRENRPMMKAHNAVARAIRSRGLERKPCEVCGASKTHAHHDNYSKPLDVRWLCPVHHAEAHGRNGTVNPY